MTRIKEEVLRELFPQFEALKPSLWIEYENPNPNLVDDILKSAIKEPMIEVLCFQLDPGDGLILSSQSFTPFIQASDPIQLIGIHSAMLRASSIIIKGPSSEQTGKN